MDGTIYVSQLCIALWAFICDKHALLTYDVLLDKYSGNESLLFTIGYWTFDLDFFAVSGDMFDDFSINNIMLLIIVAFARYPNSLFLYKDVQYPMIQFLKIYSTVAARAIFPTNILEFFFLTRAAA